MRDFSSFLGFQRLGLALSLLAFGCTPEAGPGDEPLGTARDATFVNGGFETGTAGNPPPSWTVNSYINPNNTGITIQTPQTRAGLNLQTGGTGLTNTLAGTNQSDGDLGGGASLRYCRYGSQCALVNHQSSLTYGHARNVNSLVQTMTIGSGDVDPIDGQIHVRFAIAPVLQNPGHPPNQQPYYFAQVTNNTKGTILYTDFNLSAQPGVPWKTVQGGTANEIDYIDWSLVDVAPGPTKLAQGDSVTLEIIAAGCSQGAHFGEVYVDGVGSTIPGLFVSGVGPAQANPGTVVTYDMLYKNGSASAETGIVINFTTPPDTTFQAFTAPAGATCTTPTVGTAGTITCTIAGPVAAGAADTFQVKVNLSNSATGTLVCGLYDIHSAQETTLNGAKIVTTIGCTADTDCAAAQWCNISGNQCTATLANGVSIPVDAPHTNPTLNGVCTTGAGALVCQSAVCDTVDDKCGKANGDGPCNSGNQAVVCRSLVCDPDGSCGYDTNHGPCNSGNAATVCRSGTCSTNLLCEPAGGCNVDADCTGGKWCNETTHTCTAKLTNGTAMPTDAPHTNPTLNGNCSTDAGTLVCEAGVCDGSDNKCGYDVGGGPCSSGNATVVCRSGSCSANLHCRPADGCNVDADCTGGKWCNEATHVCTAKLANGTTIPTDAAHTNPTLDGSCTPAAGSLVCEAAVCDTLDDKCGLLNGSGSCTTGNQATVCRSGVCDADGACGYDTNHGPCTASNAATVCRSGSCSANLLCQPADGCNVDSDCSGGKWCNETNHTCTAQLTNGTSIPTDAPHTGPTLDGTCTEDAATLVCKSAVCDTSDDKCGYDVGGGPCTDNSAPTVCRTGSCSANHLCQPDGGCNVDADCTGGHWCNETLHACKPTLANNTDMPSDAAHQDPTLDGTCTSAAGSLVCRSEVCDKADDKCGYADGHGPCTGSNATLVCRSGTCGADGNCSPANGCNVDEDCPAGQSCDTKTSTCKPAACKKDADCSGDTPLCDVKKGTCVQCLSSDDCAGATPVCDADSSVCVKCDGDNGSAASHACPAGAAPFCFFTGTDQGSCGKCGSDTDCEGHDGAVCDTDGGLCTSGCNVDADCSMSEWCNGDEHACLPKLPNGEPLPSTPERVAECTPHTGSVVCQSGACDPADNACGVALGDGPCENSDQCREGHCNASTGLCQNGCASDADCGGNEYCETTSGACMPRLPVGSRCENADQCETHDCTQGVCNSLVASGAGIACAVRSVPGDDDFHAGLVVALAGLAALVRRRRRGDQNAMRQ